LIHPIQHVCGQALIQSAKAHGVPKFDSDGKYLLHYTLDELKGNLGRPEDDALNTFTSRVLLLLESSPLIGDEVYRDVVNEVIAAYWQDYGDHRNDFLPAFLSNDIMRLWRTFCVNYEARTSRIPEEKNIKRRKKNYTLKHSRLLTCYSGLMYMLAVFREKGTVSPDDVRNMVFLTPTERLERLMDIPSLRDARQDIEDVRKKYEGFLDLKCDKDLFDRSMADSERAKELMRGSHDLADKIFSAIEKIGGGCRLHKLFLV
jgi:hypothetical protein